MLCGQVQVVKRGRPLHGHGALPFYRVALQTQAGDAGHCNGRSPRGVGGCSLLAHDPRGTRRRLTTPLSGLLRERSGMRSRQGSRGRPVQGSTQARQARGPRRLFETTSMFGTGSTCRWCSTCRWHHKYTIITTTTITTTSSSSSTHAQALGSIT